MATIAFVLSRELFCFKVSSCRTVRKVWGLLANIFLPGPYLYKQFEFPKSAYQHYSGSLILHKLAKHTLLQPAGAIALPICPLELRLGIGP